MFTIIAFLTAFNLFSSQPLLAPIPSTEIVSHQTQIEPKEEVLAQQTLDLSQRDGNDSVNQVFKHNILLAAQKFPIILSPGEAFAFHPNILPLYQKQLVQTIGDEFNSREGYRSAGGIVGDGVCHLASLLNWVAQEAGLETQALVDHSFRPIPGIPQEYWTSIRYAQTGHNSQAQNLYIKNNFDFPVLFQFQKQENLLILQLIALRNQ